MKKLLRPLALLLCLALLLTGCGRGGEKETLRKSERWTEALKISAKYANAGEVRLTDYADELLGGFEGGAFLEICRAMENSGVLGAALKDYEDGFSAALAANREKYGEDYLLKLLLIAGEEQRFNSVDKAEWTAWLQDIGSQYAEAGRQLSKMDKPSQLALAGELGLEPAELKALAGQLSSMGAALRAMQAEDGRTVGVDRKISGSALERPVHNKGRMAVLKVNGVWITPEVRQLLLLPLSALGLLKTSDLS